MLEVVLVCRKCAATDSKQVNRLINFKVFPTSSACLTTDVFNIFFCCKIPRTSTSQLSSMIYSPTSFLSTRALDQESGKAFWKNRVQHLFFFLGYAVNLKAFSGFIYEDAITNPEYVPSVLQIIIVCAIVGGPLIFIQMFIGQFTQKGCIAIGSMIPALYGFGYSMIVVAIFDCVQSLHYTSASLLYLITSILNYPYPSWMYCSDEMYKKFPNCFSRTDIDLCPSCAEDGDKPCFEPGSKILSADLFRSMVAFSHDKTIVDPVDIGPPQVKPATHAILTILFVYILSCRKLKSLDLSLRISLIFCLLGLTGTAVVALTNKNVWTATVVLGSLKLEVLGDLGTWMAAFRRVTEALKISCGGHVFLGSYMAPDTASHFRTLYLIGYYILFIILFYLYYYLLEILLRCRLNMPKYGVDSSNGVLFVMFPTELGLTATPQLWCTLFFTVYYILSISTMVLQVISVDETISDEFKIGDYYRYTRCAICIVVLALCLPMMTQGGWFIARTMLHELKIINLLVITVTFIIIFLYNIQRLKDDIYFVLNTPPTWYIQTCWIITASFSGIILTLQIWYHQSQHHLYMVRLPLYLLMGSPVLIGFIVKLIQYMRKQNITGMFRPSVYYGPPDLNSRLMRLLYNPRLEVRYRRRKDVCKHRCLLNNEIAVMAIEKELLLIEQIAYDLHRNEEYKGDYSEVIAQLLEHYRIMYTRFAMIARQTEPNVKLYS